VPEFRVKQDALPRRGVCTRSARHTTELGDYKVRCAELCGLQHAYMEAREVVSKENFEAWVASQTGVSGDPVARGQQAAQTYGCLACHSVDGTKLVGPSWLGLMGREEKFTDGTSLIADEAYLRLRSSTPTNLWLKGTPRPDAANYGDQLTDEIIADIIAYIKSLK